MKAKCAPDCLRGDVNLYHLIGITNPPKHILDNYDPNKEFKYQVDESISVGLVDYKLARNNNIRKERLKKYRKELFKLQKILNVVTACQTAFLNLSPEKIKKYKAKHCDGCNMRNVSERKFGLIMNVENEYTEIIYGIKLVIQAMQKNIKILEEKWLYFEIPDVNVNLSYFFTSDGKNVIVEKWCNISTNSILRLEKENVFYEASKIQIFLKKFSFGFFSNYFIIRQSNTFNIHFRLLCFFIHFVPMFNNPGVLRTFNYTFHFTFKHSKGVLPRMSDRFCKRRQNYPLLHTN